MKFFITLYALFLTFTAAGQLQKTLHQTFDLDTTTIIRLEVFEEEPVIERWAGDNILTETSLKVYGASIAVLGYYIENGRYELETEIAGDSILLRSKDLDRRPIKTKKGEHSEIVELRIFIPDTFEEIDRFVYRKKEESEK